MATVGKKILLVDDDRDLQELFTMLLSAEGYQIVSASNGEQAMTVLKECEQKNELPGLIILDSQMPVMDGKQFLSAVKEFDSEAIRRISVLLSTGNDPSVDDGFPKGLTRLNKPFDIDDLLKSVDQAFRA